MFFLNPIWLFSWFTILIPIGIHLWKKNQGKTLKIGSISLISEGARSNKRSFELHDLFLLLIRCLIFFFLTLLLAHPYLKYRKEPEKKTWILLPRYPLQQTYSHFQRSIDSLQKMGAELHYLDTTFRKIDLKDLLSNKAFSGLNPASASEKTPINYWKVFDRLKQLRPNGAQSFIYSDNTLSHFKGDLPISTASIRWETFQSLDSSTRWIQRAWFTEDRKIRLILGRSSPSGTFFKTYTLDPLKVSPPFSLDKSYSGTRISLKEDSQDNSPTLMKKDSPPLSSIWVDSIIHKIQIVSDKSSTDGTYLAAALKSLLAEYPGRIRLTQTSSVASNSNLDWVFWLKKEEPPVEVFNRCLHVFIYARGNARVTRSWLVPSENFPNIVLSGPINIYRYIPIQPEFFENEDLNPNPESKLAQVKNQKGLSYPIQTLWKTALGDPLLTFKKNKVLSVYTFYSRFDPDWSDLVWDQNFPVLLMSVLMPVSHGPLPMEKDRRILSRYTDSQEEVLFSSSRPNPGIHSNLTLDETTDFQVLLVFLLMLLFIVERSLSNRKFNADGNLRSK